MKKMILAFTILIGLHTATNAQAIKAPVKATTATVKQMPTSPNVQRAAEKPVAPVKQVPAATKAAAGQAANNAATNAKQVVAKPVSATKATATTTAVKANQTATNAGVVLKKDGTPDKRYKAAEKLKKDGTPDMRYKRNK